MTAELRIAAQPGAPAIAVPEDGLVLGREPKANTGAVHKIANKAASGQHCRIWLDAGTWQIEDLDSANGTFVNGEELSPRRARALKAGDTIQLGRGEVLVLVCTFHPRQPAPPPPPRPRDAAASKPQLAGRLEQQLQTLQQQIAAQTKQSDELRAALRAAEAERLEAEEREKGARAREHELRAQLDANAGALIKHRDELSELKANYHSQARDLAAYREKVVILEAREAEAIRNLRQALADCTDRNQKLEKELGQALARIGELDVTHRSAASNRDTALDECERLRERVRELEEVIQTQSDLLRDRR